MIVMLMLMVPRISVSVPTLVCWLCFVYKSEQSPKYGKTKYNTTFAAHQVQMHGVSKLMDKPICGCS